MEKKQFKLGKSWSTYLLLSILILSIVSFLYVNIAIKRVAEKYLSGLIGTRVQVSYVFLNLFTQKITAYKLKVANPAGFSDDGALKIGKIILDASPWKILDPNIEINSIELEQLQVNYEITLEGTNWSKLIDNIKENSALIEKNEQSSAVARSNLVRTWKIGKLTMSQPQLMIKFNQKSLVDLKLDNFSISPVDSSYLATEKLIFKVAELINYQLLHNKIEKEVPKLIQDTGNKLKQKFQELFNN